MRIDIPILVEGKYDKAKLSALVDAQIITTDGFGIFQNAEKRQLLKRLAEPRGLIVLTDSDRAGSVIRSHLCSFIPKDKLYHLYTPQVAGVERRKHAPSKDGFLGVEGTDAQVLRNLLAPFAVDAPPRPPRTEITKQDLYADGFSGKPDSAAKRAALARAAGLPPTLTANALLAALCLLYTREEYEVLKEQLQ